MIKKLTNLIKKYKVSVAEGVTTGELQSLLTSIEEETNYFKGGITVQSSIENDTIDEKFAQEMALNTNKMLNTDLCISSTIYDKDDPYSSHYALAINGNVVLNGKVKSQKSKKLEVRKDLAEKILNNVYNYFEKPKIYSLYEGNSWSKIEKENYSPAKVEDPDYNSLNDVNNRAKYLLKVVNLDISKEEDETLQKLTKEDKRHLEQKYAKILKGKTYQEINDE